MQRGNIAILIILVMVVVGGGAYFLGMSNKSAPLTQPVPQTVPLQPTPLNKSTPADMTDWKTYTRNNIFEIKYPSQWNMLTNESNDSVIDFSDGTDIPRGPNVGYIDVQLVLSAPGKYDEVFKKAVGTVERGTKNTVTVLEKKEINGYPAVKLLSETTPGASTEYSYQIFTYIKGSRADVSISALALKSSELKVSEEFRNKYLLIYDQILSTFKFIP